MDFVTDGQKDKTDDIVMTTLNCSGLLLTNWVIPEALVTWC